MEELINILEQNKIKYIVSKYAGEKSIIIKSKKYKIEIYYDNGFVSDFQKIPYTWGRMGNTCLSDIIEDLETITGKKIIYQLNIF